jgi:nucleoside-diphosphate-sugar epimerase
MKTVCITGAAGNLGSLTTRDLLSNTDWSLRLMVHRKSLAYAYDPSRAREVRCDLGDPTTLRAALEGVDEVVHYAGVLFQANPGKFLPTTNTGYFRNLVAECKRAGVKRIVLVSFPHVEGETTPDSPATTRLDGTPESHHARTRLEEEKILLGEYPQGVVLRVGMVYGRGILMPDAARWFARRRLLGVWRKQTWIHLISRDDYLTVVRNTLANETASGIYNVGDEGVQTLQEYLDFACAAWGAPRPWRMPESWIFAAACGFEAWSALFGSRSPLTRDFVRIGMASYYGDTTRMRSELLPQLKYRTMVEGRGIF